MRKPPRRSVEIAALRERLASLIQRAAMPGAQDDSALHRQLGSACAALHRNSTARAWFQLVIARNPLDTEAQQALFQLRDDDIGPAEVNRGIQSIENRRKANTDRFSLSMSVRVFRGYSFVSILLVGVISRMTSNEVPAASPPRLRGSTTR